MKDRKLLMIPGSFEFDLAVLVAMRLPTMSHVVANFIDDFGQALEKMRRAWLATDGQPIGIAGSGTLTRDTAGANLIEPLDKALVVNAGYFSDRCLHHRWEENWQRTRRIFWRCSTGNDDGGSQPPDRS